MIKMELVHRIQLATPVRSQPFVVRQDIPVCPMEYVEKEIPFKWAPAQTRPGPGGVVLNTAVGQSSDEEQCT